MNAVQTHDRQTIPGIKDTLAVSSGKGGVGKSTLAANLAVALASRGLRIGLLDADIYGPNIPGMLGLDGRPEIAGDGGQIQPLASHGLKAISMGLLLDAGTPVIWRGPMLAKMIHQFLFNVAWGELDLLLLDLPPGTGDVQITLTQTAPLTGALIVTTPSAIALADVRRGVEMFRQTEVPIIGLVENMSSFTCNKCGHDEAIFGTGGGEQTARQLDIPFLGNVPLDPLARSQADTGTPVVQAHPEAASSQALAQLAGAIGTHYLTA
ncbi:Mrp/NBP35 family ATP-binding protein [bacterium]|nr:Mrp/NBP35 family ATP-binding protein [bacterium]